MPLPDGRRRFRAGLVATALVGALALAAAWALSLGATPIPLERIGTALFAFDGGQDHLTVLNVRLPRVLAGLMAGACLAVSGAIMQAVTGNPLASPGLLGINAGAAFAVVLALVLGVSLSGSAHVWFALGGGLGAAAIVYAIGAAGRDATPLRLVLAGALLSSFLAAVTAAILILDRQAFDEVRLWTVGSLSGRDLPQVLAVLPYGAAALAAALVMARQVDMLAMGEGLARAMGQQVGRWRFAVVLVGVGLAAAAVAVAGPVGFVGLVVPHALRLLGATGHRRLLPLCAVGGALLVVLADGLGRSVLSGRDVPVGVLMALLGAPVFIALAVSSRTVRG